MTQSTVTILPMLILLLILVGLIIGIVLWITSGKGGTKGEMSCGSCGYSVRGLEGLHCPECGADLRKVGINRPKGGKRGLGIALTLGCGGTLMLGCIMSMFLWVGKTSSVQTQTIQTLQATPSTQNATLPSAPAPLSMPDPDPAQPEAQEYNPSAPAGR